MFGHQDDQTDQQHSNGVTEPVQDATLSADDSANPATPPADSQPETTTTGDPFASDYQAPATTPADDTPASSASTDVLTPADTNGLIDIKQQALQQLSPLVDHLDQTPEEKFRTTMMMIQASDDQSLVKTAYEAARQITDEKTKAQALLDIVNEINYFTQQQNDEK